MKAFIIKNKEGQYYSRNLLNPDNFLFEDRIVRCELFATEEIAKFEITFNELKDCEVAEITIAEGDLEQQLAEKDAFIKMLQEDNRNLRKGLNKDALNYAIERVNTIRKQVCDKIRQAFDKEDFLLYGDNHKIISIHEDKFNAILDQIEGEE